MPISNVFSGAMRTLFFLCSFGFAVIARSQSTQILTPDDAKRQIPNVVCKSAYSVYMIGDQVCSAKQTNTFEPDDHLNIYFLNGRRTGSLIAGSRAKMLSAIPTLIAQAVAGGPMTISENKSIKRWSNKVGSIYLWDQGEKQVYVFSVESRAAIEALNLRFGLEDGPDVSAMPPRDGDPTSKNRTNGGVLTIFGIRLGETLPFIECPKEFGPRNALGYMIFSYPSRPCFEREYGKQAEENGALSNGWINVKFPSRERPALGAGWRLLMVDANVEGMSIRTLGIDGQEQELEALKGKFGEPTRLLTSSVKNLAGAQFNSFTATWQAKEYNVRFEATQSRIDAGQIAIYSTVGQEVLDRQRVEYKAKNPGREL